MVAIIKTEKRNFISSLKAFLKINTVKVTALDNVEGFIVLSFPVIKGKASPAQLKGLDKALKKRKIDSVIFTRDAMPAIDTGFFRNSYNIPDGTGLFCEYFGEVLGKLSKQGKLKKGKLKIIFAENKGCEKSFDAFMSSKDWMEYALFVCSDISEAEQISRSVFDATGITTDFKENASEEAADIIVIFKGAEELVKNCTARAVFYLGSAEGKIEGARVYDDLIFDLPKEIKKLNIRHLPVAQYFEKPLGLRGVRLRNNNSEKH